MDAARVKLIADYASRVPPEALVNLRATEVLELIEVYNASIQDSGRPRVEAESNASDPADNER